MLALHDAGIGKDFLPEAPAGNCILAVCSSALSLRKCFATDRLHRTTGNLMSLMAHIGLIPSRWTCSLQRNPSCATRDPEDGAHDISDKYLPEPNRRVRLSAFSAVHARKSGISVPRRKEQKYN